MAARSADRKTVADAYGRFSASGLLTGNGMQMSPPRIRQKPNNLRTFFIPFQLGLCRL
jgi:hypothetical protein